MYSAQESDEKDSRKVANFFHYYKDSTCSGYLSQSIELTLKGYTAYARQHLLSARQKADYFTNVLSGSARA